MILFVIVLVFAAFDVKNLYGRKEYRLAKNFILVLFLSIIISIITLVAILAIYFSHCIIISLCQ